MIPRRMLGASTACLLAFAVLASAGMAAPLARRALPTPGSDGAGRKPPASGEGGAKPAGQGGLLPGAGSKEPINIASDRLVFLNKESKLIYIGNVVAMQGDSTLKASKLDIDIQRAAPGNAPASGAAAPAVVAAPAAGTSSVRHMEADGPVTIIAKDQIGTGDHATYDRGENKVHLNGHVTLSQGCDVVQGDTLIYDMPSGRADVVGNVRSVITPRSGTPDGNSQKPC